MKLKQVHRSRASGNRLQSIGTSGKQLDQGGIWWNQLEQGLVRNSRQLSETLTFILLLLLRDFPQLLAELTNDLLLFQLLAGQNCVKVCL